MTNEDVIRMAQEVGLLTEHNYREIINFGSMVAAAEREACAKVCEEAHWSLDDRNEYAAAIRARGQHD